jgi:hypothetical protein
MNKINNQPIYIKIINISYHNQKNINQAMQPTHLLKLKVVGIIAIKQVDRTFQYIHHQ